MDFCEICGILLFDRKSICAACKTASDEAKQHTEGGVCDCAACTRQFDWDDGGKELQSPTRNSPHKKERGPREELVEDTLRIKWEREQLALKQRLQTEDSVTIKDIRRKIEADTLADDELYIGGVDISFIKGDEVNACAAFVVLNYPDLEVVYEDYQMIKLTAPYIPGFLAFREVEFIVQQYTKLKQTNPNYLPQVIFVDGNGILHPRGFGLASHLGVLLDVACVGVAKTLIHVDGIEDDQEHKQRKNQLQKGGDTFPLVTKAGYILGKALRSSDSTINPVYISVGHQISLDTAIWLVYKCCKYRIPEPTRKADINSREYLRVHHPQGCQ